MTQELRKLAEAATRYEWEPKDYVPPVICRMDFKDACTPEAILALLDRVEKAEKAMEQQKDEWLSWHAKREQLEKDAARYQVLRNPPYSGNWGDVYAMTFQRTGDMPLKEEELDFAIDRLICAAMEASK